MAQLSVYIGWDSREDIAYQVARASLLDHASIDVDVQPIKLQELVERGVYTREVARRYDAGEQPLVEALHAKKLGDEAADHCVDEAVQLHGGTGYMHGTEVERHYRDSRILGIGGGANEVLDDLAAKLLGFTS